MSLSQWFKANNQQDMWKRSLKRYWKPSLQHGGKRVCCSLCLRTLKCVFHSESHLPIRRRKRRRRKKQWERVSFSLYWHLNQVHSHTQTHGVLGGSWWLSVSVGGASESPSSNYRANNTFFHPSLHTSIIPPSSLHQVQDNVASTNDSFRSLQVFTRQICCLLSKEKQCSFLE